MERVASKIPCVQVASAWATAVGSAPEHVTEEGIMERLVLLMATMTLACTDMIVQNLQLDLRATNAVMEFLGSRTALSTLTI